jgi:tellurite resistance protein
LTLDQAIIAVLIGSMMANDSVSPEESERAHHVTWSMRRFRRRSGETVGRLIGQVRERIVADGPAVVVQQASKVIPANMRPSVLAVAADLVLVDGVLQRQERQFLSELARQLKIAPALSLQILKVVSIKNAI